MTYHVPGEFHQGACQQECIINLLSVQVRENCGQTRANIVHHHVLL